MFIASPSSLALLVGRTKIQGAEKLREGNEDVPLGNERKACVCPVVLLPFLVSPPWPVSGFLSFVIFCPHWFHTNSTNVCIQSCLFLWQLSVCLLYLLFDVLILYILCSLPHSVCLCSNSSLVWVTRKASISLLFVNDKAVQPHTELPKSRKYKTCQVFASFFFF